MKNKRRLLTLFLAICVVLSSVAVPTFAATFTDIPETNSVYTAVNVLNKIGVINGYEDGSFKPENNVTRAEFTAMLLRTRGLGSIGSLSLENPPFPDVSTSDVSWAIGNIRTAREMNIINGYDDGTFKPNNNVLYEEAVKMIVCALGYGEMSPEGTEWYSKYIMSANTLGFLEGAGGGVRIPATRATIAAMLYNCLELRLAENNTVTDKTVLENDLQLTKKVGVIASNADTGLDASEPNLKENEIQIRAMNDAETGYETLTYVVDNAAEYKDMLGNQITFYYKEDRANDVRTVILATVKNSKKLTFDAADIDEDYCSASTIAYFEDGKDDSTILNIAADSRVVYNGKLYSDKGATSKYSNFYTGTSALPLVGEITLLDQDNDKIYDIVFVDKYETYVVSSVTASTYTITDTVLRKGLTDNKLVLQSSANEKITYLTDSGEETSFGAIKKNSVLAVKRSNAAAGDIITEVVITNKSASGTIKGITAKKSIKINSKDYEYSPAAPWVNPISGATVELTEPAMGDSGAYYLDMQGKVVAYNKNATTGNQQYGYIMSAYLHEDIINGDTLTLNMLTANGKKTKYKLYDKTKLNGSPRESMKKIEEELEATAALYGSAYQYGTITNLGAQQPVKYTTTTYQNETVIDEIVTVTAETLLDSGQAVENDKLTFYKPIDVSGDMLYYSSSKQLQKGTKTINIGSAVVFSVPENRDDVDEYSKTTLANNKRYYVGLYDVSGTTAKVVVVYSGADNSEEVIPTSPIMLVTKISEEINKDEDERIMYKLTGYVAGKETSYWMSPSSEAVVDTLQEGDVIRVGKDRDGFYTLSAEHVVFSADISLRDSVKVYDKNDSPAEDTVANKGGAYVDSRDNYDTNRQTKTYPNPQYRTIWGSFFSYDEENSMVYVSTKIITNSTTTEELNAIENGYLQSFNASWFNNAKIYRYDTDSAELKIVEETKDILSSLGNEQIFLYASGSAVKMMIIMD